MQIIVQCSRRHQNLLENWLIGKFSEWHECDVFSWPSKHFNTNTLTVRVWFHNPRRCPPPMPARGETPKLWVRYREKIDIFRNPTVVKFCLKFPPDPEWWEGNKRRASEWVREREQRRGCKRKDPHPIPNFPLLWRVRKLLGEISPPIRRWICVSMIRVQHRTTHTHTHTLTLHGLSLSRYLWPPSLCGFDRLLSIFDFGKEAIMRRLRVKGEISQTQFKFEQTFPPQLFQW